jgi:hypothetical protein
MRLGNKNKNCSMATFTIGADKRVVAGAQTKIFDKAFFFSIFLIFVVGGIWITERVLLHLIDKEITQYQEATTQGLAGADSAVISEVEDFAARSSLIKEYQERPSAVEALQTLEKATIPQVRLTEYSYSDDGTISLAGTTSDYRYAAEQLLRYRQEESLQNMQVASTDRSEAGQLVFSFSAEPLKKEEAAMTPQIP